MQITLTRVDGGSRFVLLLIDKLIVFLVVASLYYLLTLGESPWGYDRQDLLRRLLDTPREAKLASFLIFFAYWTVVDSHPTLLPYRGSRIVDRRTGELAGWGRRALRSLIKIATLSVAQIFLLAPLFGEGRWLHDTVAGTERVEAT